MSTDPRIALPVPALARRVLEAAEYLDRTRGICGWNRGHGYYENHGFCVELHRHEEIRILWHRKVVWSSYTPDWVRHPHWTAGTLLTALRTLHGQLRAMRGAERSTRRLYSRRLNTISRANCKLWNRREDRVEYFHGKLNDPTLDYSDLDY